MTDSAPNGDPATPRAADQLPMNALFALATTGFVTIMTETIPAGLLPLIGRGLGVSVDTAGQLVTAYAFGSMLSAIPVVRATAGWGRRTLLLTAVAGLFAFNTVTAISSSYALTLGARFLAGVAAGVAWGIIASYARKLVVSELQGKAISVAMVGTPVALALGVPAGTLGGSLAGWRAVFAVLSALALLLLVWIRLGVPNIPGEAARKRSSIRDLMRTPGLWPVMLVVLAWMLGQNVTYTYVAPFLARAGLQQHVDAVLLVFGVAALIGLTVVGHLVDRALRACTLVALGGFGIAAIALAVAHGSAAVDVVGVAIWGLAFGGASPLLNTAAADVAENDADIVLAMVTTFWNASIAGGSIVGALLLAHVGVESLPLAMLVTTFVAVCIVWRSSRFGFPAGARSAVNANA